jgi:RNA polymerase sigma-70 factor (ECF subfamily)
MTPDPTNAIDWIARLEANFGWLSRVVYAHVGDAHATEDVLQEMALASASWPQALKGNGAINRWLYAVAVKQAMHYLRTKIRRDKRTERYAAARGERSEMPENPLGRLIASENAAWVREAVLELTPRQREVLFLKYFDDLSCREISGRIGIEESTVKRHLADARQRMRQALLKLQDDDHDEPTDHHR